jgi:hypothetical protein
MLMLTWLLRESMQIATLEYVCKAAAEYEQRSTSMQISALLASLLPCQRARRLLAQRQMVPVVHLLQTAHSTVSCMHNHEHDHVCPLCNEHAQPHAACCSFNSDN